MTRKTGEPDPKGPGGSRVHKEVQGRSEDAEGDGPQSGGGRGSRRERGVTLSAGPTKTLTVPKEFARMVRVVPAVVEVRVVVALEQMR